MTRKQFGSDAIWVELTNVCNLKCSFCFQSNNTMVRKKGFMSFDTFKIIVDDISKNVPTIVLHHSGESFIHPNLIKFIKYAKSKNLTVMMTTNGTLLDKDNYSILSSGIDVINISLAGVDKEDYSSVRLGSSYDKLKSNILAIAQKKVELNSLVELSINVVKTENNKSRIKNFKRYYSSIDGIDKVIVRRLIDWSGAIDTNNMSLKSVHAFLMRNLAYYYKYVKVFMKKPLCNNINSSGAILWDGSVIPCCFDYNGKLTLGNIHNKSFLSIWNNLKSNKLRSMFFSIKRTKKHPVCGPCIFNGK